MASFPKSSPIYHREPLSLIFSKQKYSSLEKDISTVFISQLPSEEEAKKWDVDKEFIFTFRVAEHIKEVNYTRIQKALDGLNRKRIELVDEDNKTCIFSSIYPETKLENGEITIHMRGKYVAPYTAISKGYGGWFIDEYMTLERSVHKRIFEMCCSAVNKRINRIETEMAILKGQIGLEDNYKGRHKECFVGSVLPAVDAINATTSLNVECAMQRKGRKTFVMFLVTKKQTAVTGVAEVKKSIAHQTTLEEQIQAVEGRSSTMSDKQKKCFEYLMKYGFGDEKSQSCVDQKPTMMLFYKWHTTTASEFAKGNLSASEMKKSFYGYLKENKLKI